MINLTKIRNLFSLNGRVDRLDYFVYFSVTSLFFLLIAYPISLFLEKIQLLSYIEILSLPILAAYIMIVIALTTKRINDIRGTHENTLWFLLAVLGLAIIPYAGALSLVVLQFLKGKS